MNGKCCRDTKEKRTPCPGTTKEKAKADIHPHNDKVEKDPAKKPPSLVSDSYTEGEGGSGRKNKVTHITRLPNLGWMPGPLTRHAE